MRQQQLSIDVCVPRQGCSGAGTRDGGVPPLFGLKFVQKLVDCCNWLLNKTQCKIISAQHVCRPKLFKNLCLSLVSGVPSLLFLGLHLCSAPDLSSKPAGRSAAVGRRDGTTDGRTLNRQFYSRGKELLETSDKLNRQYCPCF